MTSLGVNVTQTLGFSHKDLLVSVHNNKLSV
jgi:hypothetical protein